MNRKTFFDIVRINLFKGKLSTNQVTGMTTILDYADKQNTNLEYLSYILATTFHETAYTMQPISERGGNAYFKKMYDIGGKNPKLAKRLGNIHKGDGAKFKGRGFVQITGRYNYDKLGKKIGVDLIFNPDAALAPHNAVKILFIGMEEGLFTGKKLSSYMDGIDGTDAEDRQQYKLSRWLINGRDKRDKIAEHSLRFEHALRTASNTVEVNSQHDTSETKETAPTTKKQGFLANLIELLIKLLKGLKK